MADMHAARDTYHPTISDAYSARPDTSYQAELAIVATVSNMQVGA